ncbi:hypothetical protein IFM89_027865 [Coptis chinensis]|uniref:Uncharacterized protein n=1 Tax=Coptis chinensis TaxID=261450 RepID=A0A835LMX9_9MAGN|nr:hypothetical protein IFM89_027865 [Coptis chinensis]
MCDAAAVENSSNFKTVAEKSRKESKVDDGGLIPMIMQRDVGGLCHLLIEHPLLLYGAALTSVQDPLHVAAMAGHLSFVKEMIRLKPEFVA